MKEKKQIVKSTDWLTKGYSEEEIARIKAEAVEEAEKEIRNKQIEEMANEVCIECKHLMNCNDELKKVCAFRKAAEVLYNAGYRKQSEGEWKLHKDGSGTCSECHITQKNIWDYDQWQNFCGHCGAKMKGGEGK